MGGERREVGEGVRDEYVLVGFGGCGGEQGEVCGGWGCGGGEGFGGEVGGALP